MTTPPSVVAPVMDPAALAERCLDAIVARYQREGWPLPMGPGVNPVPYAYVGGGDPNVIAQDDEQLVVMLDGLSPGASDASQRSGGVASRGVASVVIPRASLVVRLLRCVPTVNDNGDPPSRAELHESGMVLMADVGRVLAALYEWRRTETGAAGSGSVTLGQARSIGPSGGLAGFLFDVTVSPVI